MNKQKQKRKDAKKAAEHKLTTDKQQAQQAVQSLTTEQQQAQQFKEEGNKLFVDKKFAEVSVGENNNEFQISLLIMLTTV